MEEFFGPSMPFFDNEGTPLPTLAGQRLLKNNVLQALLTLPGERVMRPFFGTPLRSFAFQSMTEQSVSGLKSEIIASVQLHEPRVQVSSVDITTRADIHNVTIKLVCKEIDRGLPFTVETTLKVG